jgi:glycosyltransferase involved in cell wall biosynthesis
MVFAIEKLHTIYHFDMIHGFRIIPGGFAAAAAAKKLGLPLVVSSRGNDIDRNAYDFHLFSAIKFVLDSANKVTFVSKQNMELADIFFGTKKKSIVIHNSFDPKLFLFKRSLQEKLKNIKGKVIGTSGVIRRKKGFVYMLDAFLRYKKTLNKDCSFLLIGDFIPEEQEYYSRLIKQSGIGKSFVKTGIVSHKLVLNYLEKLDIFLLPSLNEGCSNAMLEAMYLKKPIIATRVGAAREILSKERGILIEPRNSEEIFNSIKKLEDNRLKEKMVNNSYRYLVEKLNLENEIKYWIEAYKKI